MSFPRTGPVNRFCLALAATALASCATDSAPGHPGSTAWSAATIARQYPAAAALLEQGQRTPFTRAQPTGFQLRRQRTAARPPQNAAFRREARATGRWSDAAADTADVVLPNHGQEPFVLTASGGTPIAVRRLTDETSWGKLDDGILHYPELFTGVDGLLFATPSGLEELLVARSSSTAIRYEVELPTGWRLHRPAAMAGLVELRDPSDTAQLRLAALASWDRAGVRYAVTATVADGRIELRPPRHVALPLVIDPEWQSTQVMAIPRRGHTATLLSSAKVLIAGGDVVNSAACELFDVRSGTYSATDAMAQSRFGHTATVLASGRVLLAGGKSVVSGAGTYRASAEVFDPGTEEFAATGAMNRARTRHTATLLTTGQVLIAGGLSVAGVPTVYKATSSAELYDVELGTFAEIDGMAIGRTGHTATALPTGQVLVAGGDDTGDEEGTAELYDPQTGAFSAPVTMASLRTGHTATLLPSGAVLVAGGDSTGTAEVYDPTSGTFSAPVPMVHPRTGHAATLLPNGDVLLSGGHDSNDETGIEAAEIYHVDDQGVGAFLPAGIMPQPAWDHSATLLPSGKVLVSGGVDDGKLLAAARRYQLQGVEVRGSNPMQERRTAHTATALQDGRVLLVGGMRDSNSAATGSSEIYDPATRAHRASATMNQPRFFATATLLGDGQVLVAGGTDGAYGIASAELFDPGNEPNEESFQPTDSMVVPRMWATATLLSTGKVLMAGGIDADIFEGGLGPGELYDPQTHQFEPTLYPMVEPRQRHVAVTLGDQRVLVTGGLDHEWGLIDRCEFFDPSAPQFAEAPPLQTPRIGHTATVLSDGRVLVTGGWIQLGETTATAEIYEGNGFTILTAAMSEPRAAHTATLLPSGEVLLVGGGKELSDGGGAHVGYAVPTAELFDPVTETFTPVANMAISRSWATATLLQTGDVFVAGGAGKESLGGPITVPRRSSELFDPLTGTFGPAVNTLPIGAQAAAALLPSGDLLVAGGLDANNDPVATARLVDADGLEPNETGSLTTPRSSAGAIVLPAGQVLVTGGRDETGVVPSAELYDPTTAAFALTGSMSYPRVDHTLTLLPSGEVLVVGGLNDAGEPVAIAEIYDPAAGSFTATGAMDVPRFGHGAAVLPNGLVAIAGGISPAAANALGIELYDPATGSFSPTDSPVVEGAVRAAPLPSGDVLIAGKGLAYRYGWMTGSFSFFTGTPEAPFGVNTLLSGDMVVCGLDTCDWLDVTTGAIPESELNGVEAAAVVPTATRMTTGELLVLAPTIGAGSYRFVYRSMAPGTVPPQIDSVSAVEREGVALLEIHGQRFSRLSAVGSEQAQPVPDIMPLVCFMPANGGGPVFSTLDSWTDEQVTWVVPATTYHGPGWLHVIVDGVPSEGTFVEVPPVLPGSRCQVDAECASGVCTSHGFCCDQACDGACESCIASEQASGGRDGFCGPVAAGTDPKDLCDKVPGANCQQTGVCDGDRACECLACRSNLDCVAGQVCAPDGRCEPFRQPADPIDPGLCTYAARPARPSTPGVAWLLLMAGLLPLRRSGRRSPRRRDPQGRRLAGPFNPS